MRKLLIFDTLAAAVVARNRINTALGLPRCHCAQEPGESPPVGGVQPAHGAAVTATACRIVRHPTLSRWALVLRPAGPITDRLSEAERGELVDLTGAWLNATTV